jgi:hypothetical protein
VCVKMVGQISTAARQGEPLTDTSPLSALETGSQFATGVLVAGASGGNRRNT